MNKKDYLKIISSSLHNKVKRTFFYLNTHSFYLLETDQEFKNCFNQADFIIPDGYSIKWAVSLIHNKQIEKVSFNHLFFENIRNLFAKENYRIFLLGGKSEELEATVKNLLNLSPKLNIVGFHNGYFDQKINSDEIINKINSCKPDILLIGMGMPDSVIWTIKNKTGIESKLIFTVGNLFDIISGNKSIAPKFLYNTPFEWLYKLFQEPLKLIPRYFTVHPYFLYRVLTERILGSQTKEL
jgi:N-acetylglucosaminyldiphosphoundecaprenol N-acetyl-beta-D-mannosaminyltransferase